MAMKNISESESSLHFFDSFHKCPDSPLFVHHNSNNNKGQIITTYKESWQILLHHFEWLKFMIENNITSTKVHQTHPTQSRAQAKQQDIVIAYLSENTADFFLSFLASVYLSSSLDGRKCDNNYKIIPLMLNTRWTSKEVYQALSVVPNSKSETNSPTKKHYTILLYNNSSDDKTRKLSHEAAHLLSVNEEMKHNHYVVTSPIPSYTKKANSMTTKATAMKPKSILLSSPSLNSFNDLSIILFTSGSTGSPKGVSLTFFKAIMIQSWEKTKSPCCYDKNTVMIANSVPFFHVGGLSSILAIFLVGGCLVFPPPSLSTSSTSSVFQPSSILYSIQYNGKSEAKNVSTLTTSTNSTAITAVNTLVLVPAMLHLLVSHIMKSSTTSFPHVKLLLIGGQSITQLPGLLDQTIQLFPNAKIVQTFACTEAASSLTFYQLYPSSSLSQRRNDNALPPSMLEPSSIQRTTHQGDYVGIPPSHVELAIVKNNDNSDDNGHKQQQKNEENTAALQFLSSYQIGRIATRGPHVMNGYWNRSSTNENNEKKNKKQDGWFVTNDLGYLTQNNEVGGRKVGLYFCGRSKDLIRTGGENVLSVEVEKILNIHPQIELSVVLGIPHFMYGEQVVAVLLLKKEKDENKQQQMLDLKSIRDFCSIHKLAGYKKPRQIFIVKSTDDIPRNASGKILKHVLKEKIMNLHLAKSADGSKIPASTTTATVFYGRSKL